MYHRDGRRDPRRAALPRVFTWVARALPWLALLPASGCVRQHLSAEYGEATRRALSQQVVPSADGGEDLVRRLDGVAAEQIFQNYLKSLATADTSEELGQVPDFGGED